VFHLVVILPQCKYCLVRKLTTSISDHDKRVTRQTSSDWPSSSNHAEVTSSLDDVVCNNTTMNSVVSQSLLVDQPCPLQQMRGSSILCPDDGGDSVTVIQHITGTANTNLTSHPSSPLHQACGFPTEGRNSEDVSAMCTSPRPPTCMDGTCVDDPLEDESPTPVSIPVCSIPNKSHTTRCMSRSPSIPLQNISVETCYKVDVTPVVLPKRMVALEGLYQADSPELDHDSLDMFDDMAPSVPCDQLVNMFDNTATLVTNPVNDHDDVMIDNIMPLVKENQDGFDDLFDNTTSLVPNNQPGKDCVNPIVDTVPVSSNQPVEGSQNNINMIADIAPLISNYQPVKDNQDGKTEIVDTALVVTSLQPAKDNQGSQFSNIVSYNTFVKGDPKVPTAHSNKLIKAYLDSCDNMQPTNKPFKDDQNAEVISPALFTPDQASLLHGYDSSPMDTSPSSTSPALGDSISTQVSCHHL